MDACGTCDETCAAAGTGSLCGDGALCPEDEACDLGDDPCNECGLLCDGTGTGPECGDNKVCLQTEECDDGNLVSGDGCDANCVLEMPPGCAQTATPGIYICISNSLVNTYNTASHCAACTEKGLVNVCVDRASCTQHFTNAIIEQLYLDRSGLACTAQTQQGTGCGWGEIMTPDYQPAGVCPTPQGCTSSINWQNCTYGVGAYAAYIYGVCTDP